VLTTEATGIRPGYVTGLTDGAGLGGGFDAANCIEVWNNILQQPPRITSSIATLNSDSSMRYYANKSPAGASGAASTCHFYLKESLDGDTNGYTAPAVGATNVGNSFTYQPATSTVAIYITNN
jgi:MSHA pilin protein MshB